MRHLPKTIAPPRVEIFILAGGLSSRMGRDKSRVRLGSRTLLTHIKKAASELDLPVRVIHRDIVPRCGPIGGIYTALKRSRADALLFLACDMPFISPTFLTKMINAFFKRKRTNAIFALENNFAGFPCIVNREVALPKVLQQIEQKEFSLQSLARSLKASTLRSTRRHTKVLFNINTPDELAAAVRYKNSKSNTR